MKVQGALFIGAICGIIIGIIMWLYGKWKTDNWFSFIKQYQPAIDEDTGWWDYIIYKKYPTLALIINLLEGIVISEIIWVIYFFIFIQGEL